MSFYTRENSVVSKKDLCTCLIDWRLGTVLSNLNEGRLAKSIAHLMVSAAVTNVLCYCRLIGTYVGGEQTHKQTLKPRTADFRNRARSELFPLKKRLSLERADNWQRKLNGRRFTCLCASNCFHQHERRLYPSFKVVLSPLISWSNTEFRSHLISPFRERSRRIKRKNFHTRVGTKHFFNLKA